MSNHKNCNSIVFLTTLGVYLGLVLIGAPPVLTQAALTRDFDVKNEIEFKDDLDNKPDSEDFGSLEKEDFPSLFVRLLNEVKTNVESGKISLPIQIDFSVVGTFSQSQTLQGVGCGGGSTGANVSDQNLSILLQKAVNRDFEPKAFELTDYDAKNSKRVKIEIKANAIDWTLKISFGKTQAEEFAEFLNRKFSTSAASTENTLSKQIYQNTAVSSENNQVFIVTRLPRASIDEFLAGSSAK